ncbi:MAG: PIN domain-containing protein [Nanoarchaeota archaeon]
MEIIVNTNKIIAALVKDSYSRKIILHSKFNLMTLDFSIKEIEKYKGFIIKKAKIKEEVFYRIFQLLLSKISIVQDKEVKA